MTVKQKKFADEYIISGNATQAAKKAGYSEKTCYSIGSENLSKPVIKQYLDEKMKEIEDKAIAKQNEVLQYLTAIMRGEEKEQTIISTGDFSQTITDIDVSAKDRIKAAELLGKRYGTWTDKVDVTSDLEITFIDDYGED
mgnify:CR=1 FL=1